MISHIKCTADTLLYTIQIILHIVVGLRFYGQFLVRKVVEFGRVVNGNKGYFVDYAASIEKFSKYLPIAQVIKNSFKISMSKRMLQ